MSDLRKLIDHLEHIDRGGRLIRELDPRTGRIVSKPVVEGEIGRKIGSTIGGVFGDKTAKFGGDLGDKAGDFLDKLNPFSKDSDKPESNKPNPNAPGNISDFSSGSGDTKFEPINPNSIKREPYGPIGNYNGPEIDPINDDPEDPKTWPPGVKKAPDFGYIDPANGLWIPTPFYVRVPNGDWRIPPGSPAFPKGYVKDYTPFKQKEAALQRKNAMITGSLLEQGKGVNLPGGAPQIPGYKQVDVKQFSRDTGHNIGPREMNWVYAYKSDKMFSKNIILIAPTLYPNMKISIKRHYQNWADGSGVREYGSVDAPNGKVHVSTEHFNVNDMILSVVIHATEPDIGAKILNSLHGSLKPA
jgi:hypothetical protein